MLETFFADYLLFVLLGVLIFFVWMGIRSTAAVRRASTGVDSYKQKYAETTQQWQEHAEVTRRHMLRAEQHMQRVEDQLDRLIDLLERKP